MEHGLELGQNIENSNVAHTEEYEPSSLSAPPGVEEWRRIKESQKGSVSGNEKNDCRIRAPKKKAKRVASLKLKDRVIGGLQGARKGGKKKKGKEIARIEDVDWLGDQDVNEDSDDIDCSDDDSDRMWRVGLEAGIQVEEDDRLRQYLKGSVAGDHKRGKRDSKKRQRGRKGGAAKEPTQVTKGGRWLCMEGTLVEINEFVLIVLIYGSNTPADRKVVWHEVVEVKRRSDAGAIAFSDFNKVLDPCERSNGLVNNVGMQQFKE
ncbi:hypothetical protein PIB30_001890 [Stylosanthes scabra]|uniref:Uncharacterized protein n=1 Tax=Stylosanthes scabra TaxID=79078 RepID=A0ABU6X0F7_9FABA|nr:hypothetical protein [Stylosanthes scabra]